jgi:hypothetical protein
MSQTARPGDRNWLDALKFALASLWRDRVEEVAWRATPTLVEDVPDEVEESRDDADGSGLDDMILALMA